MNELYPVLIGFKKAILPDNDVVVNIENKMFEGRYAELLAAERSFVSVNSLENDGSIGTLIFIRGIKENGDNKTLIGHSLRRVKIIEVVRDNDINFVKVEEYPYEANFDAMSANAYYEMINAGIKKLITYKSSDKVLGNIPTVNKDNPNMWLNMYGAAFQYVDTNELFYTTNTLDRLERLAVAIGVQLDYAKMRDEIDSKVQANVEKGQKEYFLREQLKVINEELYGDEGESAKYTAEIEALAAPAEVKAKLKKELTKMISLQIGSPESFVSRNYLDAILGLPWGKYSDENFNIVNARQILDADHYGIEEVKDRVIEHLAVRSINKNNDTNILCLVGPPGVGKTSVVASIARALNREYIRASLGGVHDEAEIRGHRRTYIGSMPGRIIAGIKKAGTMNPVFLLDEIDKLGADYKGDPSNALLEVLDPQQNNTFQDHYLDIPFDLSDVMFITTANNLIGMSRPLLDRMEIIEMGSYTVEEKVEIATRFLLPKQLTKHSLESENVIINKEILTEIISEYTKEAGVRKLEQLLAKICRKAAVRYLGGEKRIELTRANLSEFLGIPKYVNRDRLLVDKVGACHGLAWTEVGGDTLDIECMVIPGKDRCTVTGNLGDVMRESVSIAISNAKKFFYSINGKAFDTSDKDIHVHAPEGAVPKDGPSAGCAISVAVLSAFTDKAVRGDYALTGELSLQGSVLPIGGVKEKCLAAYRAGLLDIVLPEDNRKDIEDIPTSLRDKISFHFVSNIKDVYTIMVR